MTDNRRMIEDYLPIEAISAEAAWYYDIPKEVVFRAEEGGAE